MKRSMMLKAGHKAQCGLLIVLVLLVCANVEAQRYKLSTSVKSDRARGTLFPGAKTTSTTTTSTTTTTTTSTPKTLEDINNRSAISGSSASDKENKVVVDGNGDERDVVVAKPIAFATDSKTKEAFQVNVEEKETEAVRVKESTDDQITASSNTKASSDSIDEKDKKVLPKRDLPFLIQSRPGLPTLSENLLRGFTPIHEEPSSLFGEELAAFDQNQLRRQQLQRSDTEYNSNTPQVFLTKPQQSFAFSSQHAHASHYQPQPQHQQQQQQQYQQHSFNPYSSQSYHQQPSSYANGLAGGLAAASTSQQSSHQSPYSHHNHHTVHENAPTAFKLNYNPYSSSLTSSSQSNQPHISFISAAPSTKFASLVQSPYLSFTSQSGTSYPASSITAASSYGPPASGQYVGYATTVQPQLVQYQGGAATTNAQVVQQQQLGGYSNALLPIPHNHPITSYSFHNPNIVHAHNQNLYSSGAATGYGKVSNPSSVFNHANGQLSPYAYPVQAAFQVGSATAALAATAGTANVKPYYQYQQQPTVSALASSSPTLATPQYKYYPGAALSVGAVTAYNINKNEVVGNQLGYGSNGPTIATIKVNPYVPQPFSQISNGSPLGPQQQHQTTPFTFAYAKPISPYSQYQPQYQQQQQQQQTLNVATYPYTNSLAQQQTQPQQFLQQAASNQQQQQQQAYFLSPQSFYSSSPNKYQSTFAQIGGPHLTAAASSNDY